MKRYILVFLTATATLLGIAACNTMKGMGQDIEAGGDAIEDSASEHKNY